MRVGALELGLVSDGALHVDGGGVFGAVPRALWGRKAPPDEENRVELALNCLLIRSASALILVDTGMGEGAPASAAKFFGWEWGRATWTW